MADTAAWDGVLVFIRGDQWTAAWLIEEPVPGEPAGVYQPMDLTGLDARMQCRVAPGEPVLFEFASTGELPRLFVQPPTGDWTQLAELLQPDDPTGPLTGWVILDVGGNVTANYARGGKFDIKLEDPAEVGRRFTGPRGEIVVELGITE